MNNVDVNTDIDLNMDIKMDMDVRNMIIFKFMLILTFIFNSSCRYKVYIIQIRKKNVSLKKRKIGRHKERVWTCLQFQSIDRFTLV